MSDENAPVTQSLFSQRISQVVNEDNKVEEMNQNEENVATENTVEGAVETQVEPVSDTRNFEAVPEVAVDESLPVETSEPAQEAPVETSEVQVEDGPIQSSDLVADVTRELSDHVTGSDINPETVRAEAPAAVAEQVAQVAEVNQGRSLEELRADQDRLNQEIIARKAAEKSAVLAQIKSVVQQYDISTADVVEALGGLKKTRKGSPAKMKYRDPATGKEWSGRGKSPVWIKDKNKDDFLIV